MNTLFIILFVLVVVGLALCFYDTPKSQKAINVILLLTTAILLARLIGWL